MLLYIRSSIDCVTVDERIKCFPNKPWITREVKQLLQERNTAFMSGNKDLYISARSNMKRAIKAPTDRK